MHPDMQKHNPGGHTPTAEQFKTWYCPLSEKMLLEYPVNHNILFAVPGRHQTICSRCPTVPLPSVLIVFLFRDICIEFDHVAPARGRIGTLEIVFDGIGKDIGLPLPSFFVYCWEPRTTVSLPCSRLILSITSSRRFIF